MKKLINHPDHIVSDMINGFEAMHRGAVEAVDGAHGFVKKDLPADGPALLIGGGSGHEPLFLEFIGEGFADGVVQGNIFAAPPPDAILAVTKAVDRGSGVLYVYGNYAGDNFNFDMAAELTDLEGIQTATVRVMDDVASAPRDQMEARRGIAGDVFVIKVAAAACRQGLGLDEVVRITEKARDHTCTMGVALAPGTIPGENKATFELAADEIEIGMGLHGEPGVRRGKMKTADELVAEIIDRLIPDLPYKPGDTLCVLVNGYGGTTRMELLICMGQALKILQEQGFAVHHSLVGNFATCQEMSGFSISLIKLDEELKFFYDQPARCPALSMP